MYNIESSFKNVIIDKFSETNIIIAAVSWLYILRLVQKLAKQYCVITSYKRRPHYIFALCKGKRLFTLITKSHLEMDAKKHGPKKLRDLRKKDRENVGCHVCENDLI
jgi:hypothetical protein